MTFVLSQPIRPSAARADSTLRWATIAGKRVFVLRQRGAYADICYDHGHLLAEQIEDGVFPEILDTIDTGTDASSDVMDWINAAIYRRISDEVFGACSDEFRAGAQALGDGVFDTLAAPRFSAEDVRDAVVAIDVGNIAEGLTRRMQKYLAAEVSGTIAYVIGAARRYRKRPVDSNAAHVLSHDIGGVSARVQQLASMRRRVGFGCTATGLAPSQTSDGLGLHARNFDGAFFDWNNWPGLFLIDERDTNPAWHRYAAIGTAGLTYSGGISGMNDAGLAASIHQMSTVNYDHGTPGKGFDIAPYMQQRILREAGSLDEAEAIVRGARHFASWTIVVSDARSGQSMRLEINGGTRRVERTDLGESFSQSNHFLAAGMVEEHDFFGDLHFTPTFGKWLESRARLTTVAAALQAGSRGTDWAIDVLASHDDGALDGAPRSFGRTICKAYGLMGSVARTDPDRSAPKDEFWMSVGDCMPGPHASFAGFAIDWDALDISPVADRPVRRARTVSDEGRAAMAAYVDAFAAFSRPRGADGQYLGRDPTAGELADLAEAALEKVSDACQTSEDAGEIDVALRYARARLRHQTADYAGAARDWDYLLTLADTPSIPVHAYEHALILILASATRRKLGEDAAASGLLTRGEAALAQVRQDYFPGGRPHPDLDDWQDTVERLRREGAAAELPEFSFVTVE